jgi:hypothetical protein
MGGQVVMKALRQLLREFWLPLLLGAAWTAFNVVDKPGGRWQIRSVLNVFGPTFFFMSWLVAQWYRVRKQQRIEDELGELHAGVRAIQSPLLPCGLFLTLRIEASDEDLQRVFGEQRGFRAYGPDRPMPQPPFGLPPGMREGRLFSRNNYIDYRDGAIEAAGVVRPDHPAYNTLHRQTVHTVCTFDPKVLSKPLSENEPVFAGPFVKLEIYPGGRPSSPQVEPALVLKGHPDQVVGAFALDNTVLVDLVAQSLSVDPADAIGWSAASLRGAFLKATLDFFYLDGIASLPKESWPALHNFQLWLGGKARQLLAFSLDDLRGLGAIENPKPLAKGIAVCPQIIFECELRPEVLSRSLVSVA